MKTPLSVSTDGTVRSLLEEDREYKGYALAAVKPNRGILQCTLFWKSHPSYFKPVPLY